MTKVSRGVTVILVLILGFLFVDVFARNSEDDPAIPTTPEQVAILDTAILATPEVALIPPADPPVAAPVAATLTVTPIPRPTAMMPVPTRVAVQDASDAERVKDKDGNTVFDALMTPFLNEAKKRRAELAKSDPEFVKRVNMSLNEYRVNFLLFGYGESHEPPATEKAIIGSQTIISYDMRTRRADIISLTHDIRAPEVERELVRQGWKKAPVTRIDQAYNVGGFKLQRRTLEDATGLSIDFQLTFRDAIVAGLVDNVFEGVDVDVPTAFDVHAFYLDGKKYDAGHFRQGLQRFNGRQVVQFIKTVPVAEGAYDKSLEHNQRKALILDALMAAINRKYTDRAFWLRGTGFVGTQLVTGNVAYDFDPVALLINNIGQTTSNLRASKSSSGTMLPKIGKSRYIVDAAHGDGGVQWVNANAAINPITKKDIDDGVYVSRDIEVPIYSNPYGDLVTEYWSSVRTLVNDALR